MEDLINRVLRNRATSRIFYQLLLNPDGLSTTEIAKKIQRTQSVASRHLDMLEKAGLVRVKIVDDGNLKKVYTPTLKPIFSDLAKKLGKTLTDDEFDIIDKFLLHEVVRKKVFELSSNYSLITDLSIIFIKSMRLLKSDEFDKTEDIELKELYQKYVKVMSKLFEDIL